MGTRARAAGISLLPEEKKWKNLSYEVGMVFSPSMRPIVEMSTTSGLQSVRTPDNCNTGLPFSRNNVTSHYHPTQGGHSITDFRNSLYDHEKESRIVDDEYLYIMKVPEFDDVTEMFEFEERITEQFLKEYRKVAKELGGRQVATEIQPPEVQREARHRAWSSIEEIEYRRLPRTD